MTRSSDSVRGNSKRSVEVWGYAPMDLPNRRRAYLLDMWYHLTRMALAKAAQASRDEDPSGLAPHKDKREGFVNSDRRAGKEKLRCFVASGSTTIR